MTPPSTRYSPIFFVCDAEVYVDITMKATATSQYFKGGAP